MKIIKSEITFDAIDSVYGIVKENGDLILSLFDNDGNVIKVKMTPYSAGKLHLQLEKYHKEVKEEFGGDKK